MSLFKDLISQIDPTSAPPPSAPSPVQRSAAAAASPKPAQKPATKPTSRPSTPVNGASDNNALKRKASGTIENTQVKAQRKDGAPPPKPTNGAARSNSTPAVTKPNPTNSSSSIPYRGTAASAASRPTGTPVKKPTLQVGTGVTTAKSPALTPKPADPKSAGASPSASATGPPKKVGGYMAMLMKAKEKEQTKPAAPPIKHEPTKILSKKDREKMRMEAKLASKGKKPMVGAPIKGPDGKPGAEKEKEKRKPTDIGYQGTARPSGPVKKPAEVGYKGTARPSSAAAPNGRPGATGAKSQAKPARRNEYVDWSDDALDMDDDEEEDYASDVSSDMEGGMWDVEEEESEALKAARREDAEEEKRLKELARQKEERKRKLLALASSNASKRRY